MMQLLYSAKLVASMSINEIGTAIADAWPQIEDFSDAEYARQGLSMLSEIDPNDRTGLSGHVCQEFTGTQMARAFLANSTDWTSDQGIVFRNEIQQRLEKYTGVRYTGVGRVEQPVGV